MLKRIRKIKHLDEFLGFIGLAYLIILIGLSAIFVRFLVTAGTSSLRASDSSKAPLSQFNIEEAEKALRAFDLTSTSTP